MYMERPADETVAAIIRHQRLNVLPDRSACFTGEAMKSLQCDALIFDLDGVLVDSTPCIERQMRRWAARHKLDAPAVLELAHGRRTVETIRLVAPHLDAEVEAAALEAAEAADTDSVLAMPGARALLAALPPTAWAIATSNSRPTAIMRLQHTALPMPRVLISAESVQQGKPHPEAYLSAAAQLGVDPRHCLVVEDAPAGVSAGRAAGMVVLALLGTHAAHQLRQAHAVIAQLAHLHIEVLSTPAEARLRVHLKARA
jgi:mannitol-1-/sugar-/sorbitol-6-phosphatase